MAENFDLLQAEHMKEIHATRDRIEQWQHYLQDYEALHSRLDTLPDSTTHNVMVPFGSKAFFQGQLIHTNEVLVLLGDNWFVERSASQAQAIIERRKDHLKTMMESTEKVLTDLHQRMGATATFSKEKEEHDDIQEIREEIEEVEEPVDRSSVNSDSQRSQPNSAAASSSSSSSAPTPDRPRLRRIAHQPKEVNGRVAQPPRRAFPPSTPAASSSAKPPLSADPVDSIGEPFEKPLFNDLVSQLRNAERSDAIPVAKQIKPAKSDKATERVQFKHTADDSAVSQANPEDGIVQSPGDIYSRFIEEQKQQRPTGVTMMDADVDIEQMSQLKLSRDVDDSDDDDDTSADPTNGTRGCVSAPCSVTAPYGVGGGGDEEVQFMDYNSGPRKAIDLTRVPARSALVKSSDAKRPRSSSGTVSFNDMNEVNEFRKQDTPGPTAAVAVSEIDSVIGSVVERGAAKSRPKPPLTPPPSGNLRFPGAEGRSSSARGVNGKPKTPTTPPSSDTSPGGASGALPPTTRPTSKFKLARMGSL